MLLTLTHVVADVVIEWSPEEKHVLNLLLGHSPKGTTVHHKLLSLVYSLKTTPRSAAVFISFATKAKMTVLQFKREQNERCNERSAAALKCAPSTRLGLC